MGQEAWEEGAEPEYTGHDRPGCLPHLPWEGARGLVCARAPWPRGCCPRLHAGLFPQLPLWLSVLCVPGLCLRGCTCVPTLCARVGLAGPIFTCLWLPLRGAVSQFPEGVFVPGHASELLSVQKGVAKQPPPSPGPQACWGLSHAPCLSPRRPGSEAVRLPCLPKVPPGQAGN